MATPTYRLRLAALIVALVVVLIGAIASYLRISGSLEIITAGLSILGFLTAKIMGPKNAPPTNPVHTEKVKE